MLVSTAIVVAVLLNSGVIQAELINSVSSDYMPPLQFLLSQTPPDQDEINNFLNRMGAVSTATIPLTFNATDQLFIVGHDGVLLGSRSSDLFASDMIGHPVNTQVLPGLAAPLQAALGGEEEVNNLYTIPNPEESVILVIPIWNEAPSLFGMRPMKGCSACWSPLANSQRSSPRSAALFQLWGSAFLSSR